MQIQVNSNDIRGSVELQSWVEAAVADRADRFEELLARIEVYVSDENGQKSGADDKRCQIEFRPKHHQPMSVSHKAESLSLAVNGAAEKMYHALEHLSGRLDTQRKASGRLDDPLLNEDPPDVVDALVQEEFLERQRARGED